MHHDQLATMQCGYIAIATYTVTLVCINRLASYVICLYRIDLYQALFVSFSYVHTTAT